MGASYLKYIACKKMSKLDRNRSDQYNHKHIGAIWPVYKYT